MRLGSARRLIAGRRGVVTFAAAPLVLAPPAIPVVENDAFEDRVRSKIERRASDALGAPVHLGSLQIRLASLQPHRATGVFVDLPGGEVLRAERAVLLLGPLQLLGSRQRNGEHPNADIGDGSNRG
mgnify:CR=1 FL=1